MFFRLSAIAVFLSLAGVFLAGLALFHPHNVRADDFARRFALAHPPQPVPAFLFSDAQDAQHDLKDYRGHYVLLNLWATWCGPCVHEMPALDGFQDKYHLPDMKIIALNEDRGGTSVAEAFYLRYNLSHLPVYADTSGHALAVLQASGLPLTLLIDPQGREIGRIEGEADWNADTAAFLKKLIQAPTPTSGQSL